VVDLRADCRLQLNEVGGHLAELGVITPFVTGSGQAEAGARPLDVLVVGTFADEAARGDASTLVDAEEGVQFLPFPPPHGASPGSAKRAFAESLCRLIGRIVVDARDPVSKEEPLAYAVHKGATVLDLAEQIHKELAAKATRAKIWGPSAKFEGQEVGLDHTLISGDLVEIFTR
jgi:hypothetical protein